MNSRIPFQFLVFQYFHDSFTEEFLNIGLALYSMNPPFFRVKLLTKARRLSNTFPTVDVDTYRAFINSLQLKFDGLAEGINSKQLPLEQTQQATRIDEVISVILPPDDSSIRFGHVHGGMSADLDATFEDLYYRLVETYLPLDKEETRDEGAIWRIFSKQLRANNVGFQLRPTVIHTPKDDIEFDHAWKNGKWNALQPISFDLLHPGSIKRKSHEWFTANVLIDEAKDVGKLYYLLGGPQRDDTAAMKAYNKAKDLLGSGKYARKVEIIEENDAEDFARAIAPQIIDDTSHDDK